MIFYPTTLRPRGHCHLLRLSVCLLVPMPVCLSVHLSVLPCAKLVRAITREIYFHLFNLGSNILWVSISDKFDDGYRSSFDKDIIALIFVLSCLHINSEPSWLNVLWKQPVIIMNRRSFTNGFHIDYLPNEFELSAIETYVSSWQLCFKR